MTLGPYPSIGVAQAHVLHAKAREALDKGIDPGTRNIAQRRAEREAETIGDLAEEYLEKWARPRKRSASEDERILRKDVLPLWGRRKAKDIKRRDLTLPPTTKTLADLGTLLWREISIVTKGVFPHAVRPEGATLQLAVPHQTPLSTHTINAVGTDRL
jgi:hypothetical protein